MVDASKLETGQLNYQISPCKLKELLQEVVLGFENSRDLPIPFHKNFEDKEEVVVTYDSAKLIKVVHKLLDNAFKYTKEGYVLLDYQVEKDEVCVFVEDSGIGISQQQQQLIFQLFRQAEMTVNRRFEGVGMGLALAKAFVEGMNGRVELGSELGKGSTFYIHLPVCR